MRRAAALLATCLLLAACGDLVEVQVAEIDLEPVPAPAQSLVYAADGSLIATLRLAHRENAERRDLPDVLVHAVLAAEDRRFYHHSGLDARAIVRAAIANRRAGEIVQGGSTITQQLVKNRYFPQAPETLERKAAEAHLARRLEEELSKDEILIAYLNTIYFGAGAYGVVAAARTYFDVEPADLTLPQAALLAGLIRAPEALSPYANAGGALDARAEVLRAMVAAGWADPMDAARAAATPLGVREPPAPPGIRYPYFVEYVKRTLLGDPAFGPTEEARVQRLYGGGLRIHTTIDPHLQALAEQAATAYWSDPLDPEVALVAVRPTDGRVVALVGGRDFATRQFDLATQARRQPGSTFKTFALVAALRAGMRLDQAMDSGSVRLALGGDATWSVRSATSGRVTLREATARSSNGAFARLALALGGDRIAAEAASMGVTSEVGTNPAIVLGGLREGVSPLEMASAYGTLAAGGVHVPATPVTRVTDAEGDLVWQADHAPRVAMDGETAYLATLALRDVIERGTGQRARLDRPAAGKTGTVQDHRDAWFVGFTPQLSTAVWIGYPDGPRPLVDVHGVARVDGGSWPARIWRTFMASALEGEPVLDFPYPEHQAITVQLDPASGQLATEWCPFTVEVTGLRGELPTGYCQLHGPPPPETSTARAAPAPTDPPTEADPLTEADPPTEPPPSSPAPTAAPADSVTECAPSCSTTPTPPPRPRR